MRGGSDDYEDFLREQLSLFFSEIPKKTVPSSAKVLYWIVAGQCPSPAQTFTLRFDHSEKNTG
jgi:hypothetical protein